MSDSEDERKKPRRKGEIKIGAIQIPKHIQDSKIKHDVLSDIPTRLCFVGKTGSGKTNLLMNILMKDSLYKDLFDEIYVFTPNIDNDTNYRFLKESKDVNLPEENCYETIDEDVIKEIVAKQGRVIKRQNKKMAPHILLIFDDILSERNLKKSKAFQELFFSGRHRNISIAICSQVFTAIPRALRVNIDEYFLFRADEMEKEYIAKELRMGNKDKFKRIYDHATKTQYGFLHIIKPKMVMYRNINSNEYAL